MDIFILYLKYYADLKWLCSVATCIVDVFTLDKHRYGFCHLENSRRLLIVKPRVNTPSRLVCLVGNALLMSLIHVVSL